MRRSAENLEKIAPVRCHRGELSKLFFHRGDSQEYFRGQPRWASITGAIVVSGILLYATTVTAVFAFVHYHRGIQGVRLGDLLLPSRWSHFHVAIGNDHIATAFKLIHIGQRREALAFLRPGLAKAPAHRAGRLLLAQFLLEANRPEAAREILWEGLAFHRDDPFYVSSLFRFLLQQQEDHRAVTLARELHRTAPGSLECRRIAALAGATASFFRGNYDQADDFLAAVPHLLNSREGRLLTGKIDWDRGHRDLALLRFRTLVDEHPDNYELHSELLQRLRFIGAHDEVRRRSLAFQIAHADLPGPRIELLRAYHDAGNVEQVAREIAALLRDFRTDSAALLAAADFAANIGDARLAHQVLQHARAENLPWESLALLHVEALVVARDYRAAVDSIRTLLREHSDWSQRYPALIDSLQAVACHGLGEIENARLFLTNVLGHATLRADNLIALANRFVSLDAGAEARRILLRAIEADPLNQAALTRLVELDLNLNRIDDVPSHLRRLLTMRKPSPDVLRVAQHKLGSDLYLFSDDSGPVLDAVRLALDRASPPAQRL